jgi:hypothetical protein
MEVVTLAGLVGLGYAISRATEKKQPVKRNVTESFTNSPPTSGVAAKANAPTTTTTTAAKNPWSELDMMFMTGNSILPSEPQPGMKGLPTEYSSTHATPEAIQSSRPLVEMRTDGFEETPNYLAGDYIISPLTGEKMSTSDFTHNNMVPFFGGRMKQNVNIDAGHSRLDNYTGSGSLQISKKEIEPMFDTAHTPFGNPHGMESSSDFVHSRIELPRNRAGERPFEPVRVAAGLGDEYGMTGKGGFQQLEINEVMRDAMKTDSLRTSDNPKLSYNSVIVPGKHFVGSAAESSGEVRQYKPDRYFENKDGERFFVTNGEMIKESVRPIQILNHTNRPETSTEYTGVAVSQDTQSSYITGSYRNPMTHQFAADGFRNADLTTYNNGNTGSKNADYGRAAFENKPNERSLTGERVMGLNLKPAEAGANIIQYADEVRPTRRAETIGNLRQAGMPVGYATGAPAVTVWDPSNIARTTVKEGTIASNYLGMASSASAPTRLKVYDPDDVAKPTQKAQLSAKDYYGSPMSSNLALTSHEAASNARLNTSKQTAAKRRAPIAGNGGNMNLLGGSETVHQRSRKLNADSINDRDNIQNRVAQTPVGPNELGRVKQRVPLSTQDRADDAILGQLDNNPYSMSLYQIA